MELNQGLKPEDILKQGQKYKYQNLFWKKKLVRIFKKMQISKEMKTKFISCINKINKKKGRNKR